jgi:hypothetical protein
VPFYGRHYPPFFFAVAVLVAALPCAWGLAIWVAASLAAYLAAIRAILPAYGHAFADSMNFTQVVVLEQGGTGWEKIQSIFSAARMWGASLCAAARAINVARRDARMAMA